MENRDRFEVCPHCGSNMCYVQSLGQEETKLCMTCGFTTSTQMQEGSETEKAVTERQAQFYRDLRFVDSNRLVWYPAVFSTPEKGMVYMDINRDEEGKPVLNWTATPMRKLTPKEQRSKKYKGMKFVADMKSSRVFGQYGFMEAATSIGMFDQN